MGTAYTGLHTSNIPKKEAPPCIRFINSQHGWAVGRPVQKSSSDSLMGTLLHTSDGGKTWEQIPVPVMEQFTSIYFISDNKGWIVTSKGSVLNTNNGGRKWSRTAVVDGELREVFFKDSLNGWICGKTPADTDETKQKGIIFRSSDGGFSWEKIVCPQNAGPINSLFFDDEKTGWAAGTILHNSEKTGAIFYTEDGGASWTLQFTTEPAIYLLSIEFISKQKGWARGCSLPDTPNRSKLYKTENGGKTWSLCTEPESPK